MSDINEMNVGPRWYVAHTYSGYENKVKASLEKIIENRGLGHLIFDISIPTEIVIEKNGDVEKEVENKIFSCYVYIKMIMNEESWHAVRNITGVTGFVGPGSRPTPLTEEEVAALDIEQVQQVKLAFAVGDTVEVFILEVDKETKIGVAAEQAKMYAHWNPQVIQVSGGNGSVSAATSSLDNFLNMKAAESALQMTKPKSK